MGNWTSTGNELRVIGLWCKSNRNKFQSTENNQKTIDLDLNLKKKSVSLFIEMNVSYKKHKVL